MFLVSRGIPTFPELLFIKTFKYLLLHFIIMKKLLLILALLVCATITYAAVDQAMTNAQLEAKIASLEKRLANDYVALDNRISLLDQEVNNLKQINGPELFSFSSPTTLVYGVFLGLIAFLFVLNVVSLHKVHALAHVSPKSVNAVKKSVNERLKKYVDYCRFQKGMTKVQCKAELKKRGWTESQLKGIL